MCWHATTSALVRPNHSDRSAAWWARGASPFHQIVGIGDKGKMRSTSSAAGTFDRLPCLVVRFGFLMGIEMTAHYVLHDNSSSGAVKPEVWITRGLLMTGLRVTSSHECISVGRVWLRYPMHLHQHLTKIKRLLGPVKLRFQFLDSLASVGQ